MKESKKLNTKEETILKAKTVAYGMIEIHNEDKCIRFTIQGATYTLHERETLEKKTVWSLSTANLSKNKKFITTKEEIGFATAYQARKVNGKIIDRHICFKLNDEDYTLWPNKDVDHPEYKYVIKINVPTEMPLTSQLYNASVALMDEFKKLESESKQKKIIAKIKKLTESLIPKKECSNCKWYDINIKKCREHYYDEYAECHTLNNNEENTQECATYILKSSK